MTAQPRFVQGETDIRFSVLTDYPNFYPVSWFGDTSEAGGLCEGS